ncbi:MAG: nucleoside hydrolase [Armatimonadetes bacterium]|nr:nucleoside hydrolase [Armatimonadota bacterium]
MRMSRRGFIGTTAALGGLAGASAAQPRCPTAADTFGLLRQGRRIPVILDTDIGGDIDDTWALCMLLRCPELDVRLVVSDAGNATYRARILAKLLEVYERTDIPVGVGIPPGDERGNQSDWIEGYEAIHASPDPVTLICIGAVPNIAAALARDPSLVNNARFVGMHGSVRRGYGDGSAPAPEANVVNGPAELRAVFAAPWDCTVTPLDTCDRVRLLGEKYQAVRGCEEPGPRALMENYRLWKPGWIQGGPPVETASTTLFDTVAVYLAFTEDLLVMEDLALRVTDDGYTVVDETQKTVHCAMDWRDLGAFEDLLVERLTS